MEGRVLCQVCKSFETFSKVRVVSKGSNLFKCNGCHSKESSLRRTLGSWPISEYRGLTEEDKAAFMRSIRDMPVKAAVAELTSWTTRAEEKHTE